MDFRSCRIIGISLRAVSSSPTIWSDMALKKHPSEEVHTCDFAGDRSLASTALHGTRDPVTNFPWPLGLAAAC